MITQPQPRDERIVINLDGPDGNAFSLVSTAKRLADQIGMADPTDEMLAGDYLHALGVFEKHFGGFVTLETKQKQILKHFADLAEAAEHREVMMQTPALFNF